MGRAYNVIDADGHILEPLDLWDNYIDPKFRDRAPRLVKDENGKERLVIEEQAGRQPARHRPASARSARARASSRPNDGIQGGQAGRVRPARAHPRHGCSTASTPPSSIRASGCSPARSTIPTLAAAMCRAYNRWLADYCKPYPDRLFGVAMLPMQDRRSGDRRDAFRPQGARLPRRLPAAEPVHGTKMINDPMYEPFWAAAEELDISIGFHEGGGSGMPTVGIDRFEGRGARHIITHTMEMMLACLAVIWGGVCESIRRSASASSNRAAAGSRRGSTAWTAISTTRASTISA